jgi:hypothetical protein
MGIVVSNDDYGLGDDIRKWFDEGTEEMMEMGIALHCLGASRLTLLEEQCSEEENIHEKWNRVITWSHTINQG